MKLIKKLALGFICFTLGASQFAMADSSIQYKNQRGSVLSIKFQRGAHENSGSVTGTFTTAVGNCAKEMNIPMPISGFYNGNAVTITVNFPRCNQVVAMTGNFSNDLTKLHTLWLDASSVDDPKGNDWNSNIVGSDYYERTN